MPIDTLQLVDERKKPTPPCTSNHMKSGQPLASQMLMLATWSSASSGGQPSCTSRDSHAAVLYTRRPQSEAPRTAGSNRGACGSRSQPAPPSAMSTAPSLLGMPLQYPGATSSGAHICKLMGGELDYLLSWRGRHIPPPLLVFIRGQPRHRTHHALGTAMPSQQHQRELKPASGAGNGRRGLWF